jgi:hypothetical protein
MDLDKFKLDRSKLEVVKVSECPDDTEYWLSKTPDERFVAAELIGRINYGDRASERLQRILEVTKRA